MAVLPLLLQTKAGACRHKDCAICLGKFYTFFYASSSKKDSCYYFFMFWKQVSSLGSLVIVP